jgi:hypothetical protein
MVSRFLAAMCLACSATAVDAAEIRISDHPGYSIIMEGMIVPGDYDKLRNLITKNCPTKSWYPHCATEIYLASPGGSVAEAMKIGRLVRMLRLGTQLPDGNLGNDLREDIIRAVGLQNPKANYLCASACFFIAVAGIERVSAMDTPILGIHRPFIADADLKILSANQVMASTAQTRTVVEVYLKEMGVPLKYADLMFSIPKDEVRWITVAEYKADFARIVSELKDWLNARCDKRTEIEKRLTALVDAKIERGEKFSPEEEAMFPTLNRMETDQVHCEESLKDKMREDAWKAYLRNTSPGFLERFFPEKR